MGGDQNVVLGRQPHRPQHRIVALHAAAVVREGRSMLFERCEINRLDAHTAERYRAVGQYLDHCIRSYYIQLALQVFRRVGHRIEIGHGAHGRVSAARRRRRSSRYALLVAVARLAQMYVHVHKSACRRHAAGIDRPIARGGLYTLRHADYTSVGDGYIERSSAVSLCDIAVPDYGCSGLHSISLIKKGDLTAAHKSYRNEDNEARNADGESIHARTVAVRCLLYLRIGAATVHRLESFRQR